MNTLPASLANQTAVALYVSTTDTAKLIRRALKEAFPEIKFSVVSEKYSGGSSIRVRWTDGPSLKQVQAIAGTFQGGSFDGMTDCQGYRRHLMDGRPVAFGGTFVFCHREVSADKLSEAAAIIAKVPQDRRIGFAERFGLSFEEACACAWRGDESGREFAARLLEAVAAKSFEGRKSALADSVTFISDSNDHEAV